MEQFETEPVLFAWSSLGVEDFRKFPAVNAINSPFDHFFVKKIRTNVKLRSSLRLMLCTFANIEQYGADPNAGFVRFLILVHHNQPRLKLAPNFRPFFQSSSH